MRFNPGCCCGGGGTIVTGCCDSYLIPSVLYATVGSPGSCTPDNVSGVHALTYDPLYDYWWTTIEGGDFDGTDLYITIGCLESFGEYYWFLDISRIDRGPFDLAWWFCNGSVCDGWSQSCNPFSYGSTADVNVAYTPGGASCSLTIMVTE